MCCCFRLVLKKSDNSMDERECYKCHKTGHIARSCPEAAGSGGGGGGGFRRGGGGGGGDRKYIFQSLKVLSLMVLGERLHLFGL